MEATEKTARQMEFLEKARGAAAAYAERLGHAPRSYIETFGCQMNARDSEKLRGILREAGFADAREENEADLVLYNTCTVRDNADQHVYGRLGRLGGNRKSHPGRIVGLCGCLMQEPHAVEKIKKSYPFVNLVFGTHNLYAFPELLYRAGAIISAPTALFPMSAAARSAASRRISSRRSAIWPRTA